MQSWDSNPGPLGEKCECYLSAMQPSKGLIHRKQLLYSVPCHQAFLSFCVSRRLAKLEQRVDQNLFFQPSRKKWLKSFSPTGKFRSQKKIPIHIGDNFFNHRRLFRFFQHLILFENLICWFFVAAASRPSAKLVCKQASKQDTQQI